ncbi:type II secretion system protein N [Azonexus sp.]|uniref:type II secretion system protein N n=1 Tax=Azonexus sp. TaxID=1872668 RepID=UPI0035AEE82E
MPSLSLPRHLPTPAALLRFAAPAATALVALAGSWLFGGLAGDFLLPASAPVHIAEHRPQPLAERLAGRLAFAGSTPSTAAAPLNLTLAGISASADASVARALIRVEGQAGLRLVAIGDEIGNGLRLRAIESDAVTLAGPAGDSRLTLPKPAKLTPTTDPDD